VREVKTKELKTPEKTEVCEDDPMKQLKTWSELAKESCEAYAVDAYRKAEEYEIKKKAEEHGYKLIKIAPWFAGIMHSSVYAKVIKETEKAYLIEYLESTTTNESTVLAEVQRGKTIIPVFKDVINGKVLIRYLYSRTCWIPKKAVMTI
jgi:hypothetical protein